MERQIIKYCLEYPEKILKTKLFAKHFDNVLYKNIFSHLKLKAKADLALICPSYINYIYEKKKDWFTNVNFEKFKTDLFSGFDNDFDFKIYEYTIIQRYLDRITTIELQEAQELIDKGRRDVAITNFELKMKELRNEMPKDVQILNFENHLKFYEEQTKDMKNDIASYYSLSHTPLANHIRIDKFWLCVFMGTTGSGKTIFLAQEAVHFATTYKKRVLFITDENSQNTIMNYMICNFFNLRYKDVIDRKIDLVDFINNLSEEKKQEFERLKDLIEVLELPDIPLLDVVDILENAEYNGNPYGLLCIDSFNEIHKSNTKLSTLENGERNAIMLEEIPKRFKMPIYITAQLDSEVGKHRPNIDDVTEYAIFSSKMLPKKAGLVIAIHGRYTKIEGGAKRQEGLYLKICKSRSGGKDFILKLKPNFDNIKIECDKNIESEDINLF